MQVFLCFLEGSRILRYHLVDANVRAYGRDSEYAEQ